MPAAIHPFIGTYRDSPDAEALFEELLELRRSLGLPPVDHEGNVIRRIPTLPRTMAEAEALRRGTGHAQAQ